MVGPVPCPLEKNKRMIIIFLKLKRKEDSFLIPSTKAVLLQKLWRGEKSAGRRCFFMWVAAPQLLCKAAKLAVRWRLSVCVMVGVALHSSWCSKPLPARGQNSWRRNNGKRLLCFSLNPFAKQMFSIQMPSVPSKTPR